MAKPASKAMIGGFVIGALALLVAGVLVFGSGRFLQKTYSFVMYFESSVTGLSVGSPVVFRGVKVGSVTDIALVANPETLTMHIPVYMELVPERIRLSNGEHLHKRDPYGKMKDLVERGLRAQLQTQSFVTGQLQIGLDFFPDKPAKYVNKGEFQEIPTVPTKLEELTKTIEKLPLEQLVNEVYRAVEGISSVVRDPEIKSMITALKDTSQNLQVLVKHTDERIGPVLSNAEKALDDYGKLARNLDVRLTALASKGENALDEYAKLARSVDATLDAARAALRNADKTLVNAQSLTAKDSPLLREVVNSLDEVNRAARAVRVFAEYLERHPEALLQGKAGPAKGR